MNELNSVLRWVQIFSFVVLGIVAIVHWRQRRGPAAGWLAATFGSLALVSVAGAFFPEKIEGTALTSGVKALLVVLSLFPFLLYKFMSTFEPQPRWRDNLAKLLTTAVVLAALMFKSFPSPDEPLTPSLISYLVLFITDWVFLSSVVAVRLWMGGRGQPGVARRRMRLLSAGAAGLALALALSIGSQSGSDPTVQSIAVQIIALATAPLFLLGFAPPRLIRLAWRREEELALRDATAELMQALNPRQIAEILFPNMCALIGGDRATMRNADGEVISTHYQEYRSQPESAQPAHAETEDQATIRVVLRSGEIAVHASRFTPFFGSEEQDIVKSLGVLADLALARSELFEAEERKNSFLRILQQVTSSVNGSEGTNVSLQSALDIVCTEMGWVAGHAFLVGRDPDQLESSRIWHIDIPAEFEDFKKVTEATTYAANQGLVGKVFATGESIWIKNTFDEEVYFRGHHLPVQGAAALVPIRVADNVVGVLEFIGAAPKEPDHEVLEVMSQIGIQLGRAVERTRSREELSRRAQDLARSNSDLEQFAYVASHDLQEPLRMVSSYMQLLAERYEGKLDETGERYMHYAVDGATRMQSLVRDLLTFSRVGSRGAETVPTSLESVLEQTLADLSIAIDESGASISHDPLPTVLGDAAQLNQLFQNLVGNAIKFRGEDPPVVEIRSVSLPQEWLISVKDNGVGFDPKYAERIFIIFKRLHSRDEYAGTGIGLAISKKIVERHRGRIWAESEPGLGTTVFFSLPKMEEAPA